MRWTEKDFEECLSLFKNGLNCKDVAEKLNRDVKSIQNKIHREGLQINDILICKQEYICSTCKNLFIDYKLSDRKFCSKNCSASYNNKIREIDYNIFKNSICIECKDEIEIKKNASIKNCRCNKCKNKVLNEKQLLRYRNRKNNNVVVKIGDKNTLIVHKKCKECDSIIEVKYKSICNQCKINYYKYYRPECTFNFSLNEYPNEFNFDELKKYGFYSPTNKKNNLDGVSRDHNYSVKDGFKNNISPLLIKHPANCILLKHTENNKKNSKSEISLSELLYRIEIFEEKYKSREYEMIIKEIKKIKNEL